MNGDTSTHQERSIYLEEKLKTLVEQVDEGYGKALLEQLIHRMELIVQEFVAEVDQLVEHLRRSADTQKELWGKIRQKDVMAGPIGLVPPEGSEGEVPEWEQRLADLEGSGK